MRFGIEQMQASLLIQHARTLMAGAKQPPAQALAAMSVRLDVDVAAQVAQLADLGFRLIELNPDLTIFFPQCYNLAAIERLRRLKEECQLSYTVHLPLWSLEPSTPMQMVREGSVDTLVDAVLRLAPLEPEVYVLHATGALAAEFSRMKALEAMRPLVMSLFAAQARRSIEQILERTGLSPRLIAVETVEFPFDLTLGLAEAFDLSMCLDTGHVLAGYTTGVSLFEALQQCLPRLAEVHLHDAYHRKSPDGTVRIADHLPLGAGDLPLGDFLDKLAGSGFSGPVIFELTIEEATASLEAIRK
ncbi:MAG: sugar phosphate isomerase/epimerase, partial [Chloroflexi bacterium]|nr:sugar phosphate isomerase/epimerase [Chloroflexota bacterium]